MPFADNLRHLRVEQFLSQAELARRAGVHALTITRLEAGTTAPSTRTVRALANALGCDRAPWLSRWRSRSCAVSSDRPHLRVGRQASAQAKRIATLESNPRHDNH
jgi:transcriptional regulator with XRE-family HTH domain